MGGAARLLGWGVRAGVRGSWWAMRQPWALARLGSKEMAGASAFGVSYWAGLILWFFYGLLALYAAGWAHKVGWLTPAAWALSATGILFWLSLLVYLRTRAVRTNARSRAMMRKMFDTTQETAAKVERVEKAVETARASAAPGMGVFRGPVTDAERETAALFAEQAGQARQWTGGTVPAGPEPVFPMPRVARRFGEAFGKGWRRR